MVSLSNEKDPDKEDFKYCLASPVDVGTWRTREATLRSSKQAKLVEKHPNRLTWAAFHAGEGWQIGENGALRWIEWGPQVADSNYEAEEVKNYYNALEGLTPASRWVIDYDRSTGLLPKHFGNVLVTIEFTYGMIEENIRQTFAAGISEQLGAVTEFQSAPALFRTQLRRIGPMPVPQEPSFAAGFKPFMSANASRIENAVLDRVGQPGL